MNPTTSGTTIGVFTNRDKADSAIAALQDAGFGPNEIGVVTRNTTDVASTRTTAADADNDAEEAGEGAMVGAITGAGIGGLIGVGVLSGIVPVIGPALFAGTLGVLASNAAGGAAVAGIIGALTAWGVPEEDARYYEGEVAAGRIIVTVTAGSRYNVAREILRDHGAITREAASTVSSAT